MRTFSIGGIHPPGYKLSAGKPIQRAALPKQSVVLLNQQIGALAVPVVAKGDEVKTGQLIAKSGGFVSANIHAPVSGKISKIDLIPDTGGYKHKAIFIDVVDDVWVDTIDRSDVLIKDCNLDATAIVAKIAEAGVVGMGGAAFPTQVKLTPPHGKKVDVLIVNAVECEPYLTSDHQLMMEKGEEILIGTTILMKAIQAKRGVIGIENNKPDAIAHLKKLSAQYPGIEIIPLKVQYPQGGEKQLIEAIIGRQVPSGAFPIEVGAIVQNVATVFAVYEAVQKNKPLFERIITVTGKSVSRPGNYLTRIGTPLSDLMHEAGGLPEDAAKVIGGGPMMGKALVNLSVPVTKGCSGLLVLTEKETLRKEIKNCIRCTKCVRACPMGLEPYLFMTLIEHEEWGKLEKERIMDCIECGCCTYSCPSARPLLDYLKIGKSKVGEVIRTRKQ
ncbi:MAG: electron transport complex subunit RsxC [Bacteroidales bacterium]|nr:electron transport complex subunit RsxC [Bacteroidales bacterium]MDD3906688.1 electron transport complex subunit RsxC [Bacteroidales bacterium]MDD4712910.1 electron transport complex subunit RsxC [Bacteroidales bacterium]